MESNKPTKDPATWMETTIKNFINNSPENTLKNKENDKAWADPLVGFSRGDDPLYREFKAHIGSFHWTPLEIFRKTFPQLQVRPDELTVISWILPQIEKTKSDNRKQTVYPAERWVRARMFGEEGNEKLRSHVVATLQEAGYEAIAPMLSPFFERKTSERYGFASTWSERHAAYASGLGTFGLCDGLITPKGKAMRCGSVVARIRIPPTNRPYTDHRSYCLFFAKAICGECIPRCPVGAITEAGHDKEKCGNYIRSKVVNYAKSHFNLEGQAYGCGLCQTDVPCESKIPTEFDVK
ncbi:MAG: epoxyqueuosine reductase [Deltaproteobacteria bacterium]|nr:epoxyqueuosine reductase [Deltaproteobacteria bacterium]